MVEMQELANILHAATRDSLVVLDEVGRGTATYDGISIAWAATEYLVNRVRSKCLFATHYHELTSLAEHLPGVENVHVAVAGEPDSPDSGGRESRSADGSDGDVTFLRTVREGPADRSYGIHVADLAGVPDPVVDRSRDVLHRLREEKAIEARGASSGETVQAVFDLEAGQFRSGASADGGAAGESPGQSDASGRSGAGDANPGDVDAGEPDANAGGGDENTDEPDADDEGAFDPAASVLAELSETDLAEQSPVELMATVEEWQERLDD
jgi:DNA mismatch repair protein MutS